MFAPSVICSDIPSDQTADLRLRSEGCSWGALKTMAGAETKEAAPASLLASDGWGCLTWPIFYLRETLNMDFYVKFLI